MRQVQQKEIREELGKRVRLIHKRRRRGCGSPSPAGHSSGAEAKSEQPVCEEAVAFTLGCLQQLELFALFAQHFHVEGPVGFVLVLVDLEGESVNEGSSGKFRQREGKPVGRKDEEPSLLWIFESKVTVSSDEV